MPEKVKFKYSPLGEAFNKAFYKNGKNKKVIKYDNDLVYDSVHNLNKYSLSKFYEISSTDSKFGTINKLYGDLLKLSNVNSKTEESKEK